jgi:purine-binding chemotaxis protein CheW
MTRAAVDWDRVHSRLRSSERALEESRVASPERIDAAFRRRALRLAQGKAEEAIHAAGLPVLVFRLGKERYAIEVKDVAEAIRLDRCTPVPGSSSLFAGVISLRGELFALLDTARLFGLPESASGDGGFVLLMRWHGQGLGLKVDRIEDLRELRPEELTAASQGRYVTRVAPGMLMLLSADAVLTAAFSQEGVE